MSAAVRTEEVVRSAPRRPTVAQRWTMRDDVQAVIQIFAKSLVGDARDEVALVAAMTRNHTELIRVEHTR